jgi:hypothetical protein
MVIKKSWNCLKCENWIFEPAKFYNNVREIPCFIGEVELDNLDKCPHFKRYYPPRSCPSCGSKGIKYFADKGERICLQCGTVVEERLLASHRGISKGRSR